MSTNTNNRTQDQRMIDRITKLLALAENNSNKYQAEAARRKALKLMREYGVSQGDLDQSEYITKRVFTKYKQIPSWLRNLYDAVGKFFGVYVVYGPAWDGRKGRMILAGTERDIENVEYMTESLENQIWGLQELMVKEFERATGRKPKRKQCTGYRMGLVIGVNNRLEDMLRKVTGQAEEEGLVLVDKKMTHAKKAYAAEFGKTVKNKSYFDGSMSGRGKSDAERVRLHRGVGSNTPKSRMLGR